MTNDHHPDDRDELASAYVDGQLDDADQARVEGDAYAMELVERLRTLRRALATVEPPDPAQRDRAIAAALAAVVGAPPAPPARRAQFRRHRRIAPTVMAAAAAVVLVGVAGVFVLGRGSSDDDSAGPAADSALTASAADAGAERSAADGDEELATADTAAGGAATSAAAAGTALDAQGGSSATTASGSDTTNLAAADMTTGGTAISASTVLRTGAELYDFAVAAAAPAAGESQEFAEPICPQPDGASFRGFATYAGEADTIDVEVFLVNGIARAVDAATCAVVAEAGP